MSEPPREAAKRDGEVLGLLGFLLVARAGSNMILARGVAGSVRRFDAFSLEHRGAGLLPARHDGVAGKARRAARAGSSASWLAGFLGMFICGGPVYVAGVTTRPSILR